MIEDALAGTLMILAAVCIACALIACVQLDLGWALLLAAMALVSFEAALFVPTEPL